MIIKSPKSGMKLAIFLMLIVNFGGFYAAYLYYAEGSIKPLKLIITTILFGVFMTWYMLREMKKQKESNPPDL